ncbi:hypothetical protein ACIHEJ_05250 [Streptomyces sp. NPDC052301]|uniref:hypothetical protein n=1 Tax=Streptomyces sp. NPDC052301 TaxID=3365687 RepID=UPI0037D8ED51
MPAARTATPQPVRYERHGPVAVLTMDRPVYRSARNSAMTCALDRACHRAADDEVEVVVLAGAGKHFSAGHDTGTPERDARLPVDRTAGLRWDHSGEQGAESRFARESEVHLGMCRRRELPGPAIPSVRGACVTAGLMQGMHAGRDSVFGLHHLAHAHDAETAHDALGGTDVRATKAVGGAEAGA